MYTSRNVIVQQKATVEGSYVSLVAYLGPIDSDQLIGGSWGNTDFNLPICSDDDEDELSILTCQGHEACRAEESEMPR
ncbi:hypothetical protein J6590_055882 [Homalodisca vitripennis]|nr:hypothetical protein J6590_055882 [Homalodisca vitripennis]